MFTGPPFCDCLHTRRQHQLGRGERSFKEVPFSQAHKQAWLEHHWLSCSNFALGHKGWAENPRRGIPGPFQALSQLILQGIKPVNPTSRVWKITIPRLEACLQLKSQLNFCRYKWCLRFFSPGKSSQAGYFSLPVLSTYTTILHQCHCCSLAMIALCNLPRKGHIFRPYIFDSKYVCLCNN